MKYKFIPVDNNINKAIAFANTLDSNNIKNVQRIKQKPFYIETLDVVKQLQNEGWQLKGVAEQRGSNRKITSNYAQLHHPDFAVLNNKGKTEAFASITLSNSCTGNSPELPQIISKLNDKAMILADEINEMKRKQLSLDDMRRFAVQAAQLRFDNEADIDIENLLKVNRLEDEGNDVWTVFNRLQENLTADVKNFDKDIFLNQKLFELADQYVMAI